MEIKESNQFQVQPAADIAVKQLPSNRNKASVELFRDEMNQIINSQEESPSFYHAPSWEWEQLAKIVHENVSVVDRFDIRGWVTVSQTFKVRELLVGLLHDTKVSHSESLNDHQLRDILHKHLCGRRYLIVVDDVWDVKALDKLKLSFPDDHKGSRILVTTRMSNVATHSGESSFIHKMNFLDERKSWELFCNLLFGNESCPPEMKETAETVARNCKGLLLALSVLGGLLANSNVTQEYLEKIAGDTMAIVNSTDEDHCLKILSTSYNDLPVHLKPCFLYLGVYEEDRNISAEDLKLSWVAEGILKPSKIKSAEEVVNDYLKDLISRNLIFVSKFGYTGGVKYCKVHDLVRDLCLREAHKDRFLCVTQFKDGGLSVGLDSPRRVAIHEFASQAHYSCEFNSTLRSSVFPRSLIYDWGCDSSHIPFNVKLLRVLRSGVGISLGDGYFNGFNLRFISVYNEFPNSVNLFWNLHSLRFTCGFSSITETAPSAIWEIPQLRRVWVPHGFYLSDAFAERIDGRDDIVLENLQEVGQIFNFKCTEEVLRKMPNVKKLAVAYTSYSRLSTSFFENLGRLQKLETLSLKFWRLDLRKQSKVTLDFPLSLKELCLEGLCFNWEDMGEKIGLLHNLERLELVECNWEEEWETGEDQFLNLKCLKIIRSCSLERWVTESAHFPCLEHLGLKDVYELEEIPSEIGDIPTLRSINVVKCKDSVGESAKMILKEQRSFGIEDLIVTRDGERVRLD